MIARYRCRCMKHEREVEVDDRIEGQDWCDWVGGVIKPALDQDHAAQSPDCPKRKEGFTVKVGHA